MVAFEKRYHGMSSDLGCVDFRRHLNIEAKEELFSMFQTWKWQFETGFVLANQLVCGYVNLKVWKVTGISFMQVEFLPEFSWNRDSKIPHPSFPTICSGM